MHHTVIKGVSEEKPCNGRHCSVADQSLLVRSGSGIAVFRLVVLLAIALGDLTQACYHPAIDRFRREVTLGILAANLFARQQAERLVDMAHGIDGKLPRLDRFQYRVIQHQVGHIGVGNNDALLTGKAARLTEPEEALNLLVDAADGLHLTKLVDRAGDGKLLLQWRARQTGNQRADLTQ